ncbi:MAG: (deoxy)nucleoside triphosphate pyrophosphohydrolase [Treponema sp.]|jgi:8-oxo-dGTP diphosphatase|nr:(deoxy)nucleoside triphosphate pyrophosphohydrolase [Treponema sp.]
MDTRGKSVAGIALQEGRVFIARRIPGGALGGKWEFPGGKVEAGESDQDALIREYAEELGVSITPGPFLGSACFEHRGVPHVVNAYRVYWGDEALTLSEHTEWRWASLAEIQALDFADSDRKLFPGLQPYLECKP